MRLHLIFKLLFLIWLGFTAACAKPSSVASYKGNAEGFTGIIKHGSLDLTFNYTGTATIADVEVNPGHIDIATQKDGKIVYLGATGTVGDAKILTSRFNPDGSLDTTFGIGGKAIASVIGFKNSVGISLAIQADGKILIAGIAEYTHRLGQVAFIIRQNTDGSLDTAFGGYGNVLTRYIEGKIRFSFFRKVLVQADGKIVASGGFYRGGFLYEYMIARYHSNGSIDSTFGNGGIATASVGPSDSFVYGLSIQKDGKYVLAGDYCTEPVPDMSLHAMAIVRFTSNGLLDDSFGMGGIIRKQLGDSSRALSVAVQSDSKIVFVAEVYRNMGSWNAFVTSRLNEDGSDDSSYGDNGTAVAVVGDNNMTARASVLNLQADGKILVAGYAHSNSTGKSVMAVARFQPDGHVDTEFGEKGVAANNMDMGALGSAYVFLGMTIQPDGKILVGSYAIVDSISRFALTRFNP